MSPDNPEALARESIEKLLTAAGWIIQNRQATDLGAARRLAAGKIYRMATTVSWNCIARTLSVIAGAS
jgi:hypothetical protein